MIDSMNMNFELSREHNLTKALLERAAKERSILLLAMAFRAHKPSWGSQSLLFSMSLLSYLVYIDWNLKLVTPAFESWYAFAQKNYDPLLLGVRVAQMRELMDLTNKPRTVTLRANPLFKGNPELKGLYVLLSNQGYMQQDLNILAERGLPAEGLLLGDTFIRPEDELYKLFYKHWGTLKGDVKPYLEALLPQDQPLHPNMLMSRIMNYTQTLAVVSNPFENVAKLGPNVQNLANFSGELLLQSGKRMKA